VRFTGPLRDATFTKRINRFLASILIDGKEQFAHVPNSGRMGELLTTGRGIKLREGKSRARKTRFDVSLVDFNGSWVSIDARLPGVLLAESIEESDISDFNGYFPLKREVSPIGPAASISFWERGGVDVSWRPSPSPW
jgi:sugar fermentation stimulation protein A